MPDLSDPDDPVGAIGTGAAIGAAPQRGDASRTLVAIAGLAVSLVGIVHGLVTGYEAKTLPFAIAGLVVFAALAVTCATKLLSTGRNRWAPRALLASLFGLSLVRLLGFS